MLSSALAWVLIQRLLVPPQSLQTDAYDHYSAIYSLLADRLKKHKTLPVILPTPRPITYPLNAVQVIPSTHSRSSARRHRTHWSQVKE